MASLVVLNDENSKQKKSVNVLKNREKIAKTKTQSALFHRNGKSYSLIH